MKLRHKLYPSPLVYTSDAGEARFEDYIFETEDKKLGEALKKSSDIELVAPAKTKNRSASSSRASSQTQESD